MKSKKIDWSNHLIELCVVFIGITLAFMLNNWRENHTDQLMAEKYINSFRNDIANDYTALDSIMKSNERKLLRITNFINSLKDKKATIADAERIMGDLAELNPFYPKLSTFESIKYSGNLNILTDYNFREKLIQYYQSLDEKKLVEEVNIDYTNNYIIPFIYKNADFLNQRIINREVLSNYNFTNLVLGHYQLLVQIIDNYKNIYKLNRELELILAKK
jgi:hypothetical protein